MEFQCSKKSMRLIFGKMTTKICYFQPLRHSASIFIYLKFHLKYKNNLNFKLLWYFQDLLASLKKSSKHAKLLFLPLKQETKKNIVTLPNYSVIIVTIMNHWHLVNTLTSTLPSRYAHFIIKYDQTHIKFFLRMKHHTTYN